MIKHINHQNFLTTAFVATKKWELQNVDNDDVVLLETIDNSETDVALEYVDYTDANNPVVNTDCNIAIEQQDANKARYQEGATGSGIFYPDSEPRNNDGTFKRLVHDQTRGAFYNKRGNPTQIFGMDYIDFSLGKSERYLSDSFRMFTIPRNYFGEKIVGNSVYLYDETLDDNVQIHDDGYQNLLAGKNLFSKVQEVISIPNILAYGSSSIACAFPGTILAPSNLSASFISTQSYFSAARTTMLTWTDNSLNETGFMIERSINNGSWSSYLSVSINITGTYDPDVELGNIYNYRVYAFNTASVSNYSNTVNVVYYGAFDNFESYLDGQTDNFDAGVGNWNEAWFNDPINRFISIDSFESYSTGQTGSFNAGSGWTTQWQMYQSVAILKSSESFESYSTGQTGSFNAGSGWTTQWTII